MTTALTKRLNPVHAQKKAPPKAPPMLVNHIALILDNSGSMGSVRDKALDVFNDQIKTIKEEASLSGQHTTVSIFTFAEPNSFRRVHYKTPPNGVDYLTRRDYAADGGSTALEDAVSTVVTDFKNAPDAADPNSSFLIITVTDGQENASRTRTMATDMARVASTDRWTFAFLVPPGGTPQLTQRGVPAGNVKEWEQTERSMREMSVATSQGIGSYFVGRAAGKTHTDSFYTDLSRVPQSKVAAIADLTADFKRIKVEKEDEIAPFVRAKGYTYSLGTAYYELTKPERIASHKQIVIMDRSTKRLHGGPEARQLIGITAGPGVECRVKPGNHANYRIFVSSTSTNRKLVRGTDVLLKVK
jgi:hypothetical protein